MDSKRLLGMAKALKDYAKSQSDVQARIGDGTELVLELNTEKGRTNIINSCGYYFVDHVKRVIFWAHSYTCEPHGDILFNVKAAKKLSTSSTTRDLLCAGKRSIARGRRHLVAQI
jgi:hypothetical protein